jgi:hypothetical protein
MPRIDKLIVTNLSRSTGSSTPADRPPGPE